jgi:hypothetical protein
MVVVGKSFKESTFRITIQDLNTNKMKQISIREADSVDGIAKYIERTLHDRYNLPLVEK